MAVGEGEAVVTVEAVVEAEAMAPLGAQQRERTARETRAPQ